MDNGEAENAYHLRNRMTEIDHDYGGDPEAWHVHADEFLLRSLNVPMSSDFADEIRTWFKAHRRW